MRFRPMPGWRFGGVEVSPLVYGVAFDGLIADKTFDSNAIIADLDERGAAPSSHNAQDALANAGSTLISTPGAIFFRKLKVFQRIVMRARKTDCGVEAMIHLATTAIDSR